MKKSNSISLTSILILIFSTIVFGQKNPFQAIPIDRTDGFYVTIDYDSTSPEKEIELTAQPGLTVKHIKKVKTIISRYTSQPEIAIRFTKKGSIIFHQLTKENIGKPIAIVLDKKIVYLPIVQSEISGGRVVISGDFSIQEIDEMANRLKKK
ncbi:MAG: hypothetical protein AB8B59_08605 [Maribacter sp.]